MASQDVAASQEATDRRNSILSEISREMVRLYKEQFGRGPTRARTDFAGPDVVISTCSVGRGDRLLAVLGLTGSTPVVFEAPKPDFERYAHLAENSTLVPMPVTQRALVEAVAAARAEATEAVPPSGA